MLSLAALALVGQASGAWADGGSRPGGDRIVLPPDRRRFRSASGRYTLALQSDDHWKTKRASGELHWLPDGGEAALLWQRVLPHENGPRHVLVLESGAVVLVDEWINVASRYALMLLSKGGATLALFGFDDLVRLLNVPRRTVRDHGRLGLWLSADPEVSDDGTAVQFSSAGQRLRLDVADGRLSVLA